MAIREIRHNWLCRIVAFAALAATAVSAEAGLILSFSPSSQTVTANGSNQGSTTISVQAAADSGTQTLRSYDIYVDIVPPSGSGIPAGWTRSPPVEVADFDLFFQSTSPSQGDVFASGGQLASPALSLTTTPTTLFTFGLTFNGNNGAVNGDYSLAFLTDGNFEVRDGGNNLISPVTTNGGTITLANFNTVATPEPSTWLLFLVAGLGWGGRQYFRRHSRDGAPVSGAALAAERISNPSRSTRLSGR